MWRDLNQLLDLVISKYDNIIDDLRKLRVFIIEQGLPESKLKIKIVGLDDKVISKISEKIDSVKYMIFLILQIIY